MRVELTSGARHILLMQEILHHLVVPWTLGTSGGAGFHPSTVEKDAYWL